jgi:hypothetical protein
MHVSRNDRRGRRFSDRARRSRRGPSNGWRRLCAGGRRWSPRRATGHGRRSALALAAQVSNAERAIAQALACERWPAVGGRPGERALDEETYARATGSTGRGCGPGGSPRRLRGRRRVRPALLPTLRRDGSLQADPRRRLAGTPQAEITVVHHAGKAGVDRDSHGGPQSKPAGSWRIATRRTPKPRVPAGERRRRAARGGARGARLNGLPKGCGTRGSTSRDCALLHITRSWCFTTRCGLRCRRASVPCGRPAQRRPC